MHFAFGYHQKFLNKPFFSVTSGKNNMIETIKPNE